ncbi:hypothetical protein CR513_34363, partial [Mucuna pruriens]
MSMHLRIHDIWSFVESRLTQGVNDNDQRRLKSKLQYLCKEYKRYEMSNYKSIKQYLSCVTNLANMMRVYGEDILDNKVGEKLLCTMVINQSAKGRGRNNLNQERDNNFISYNQGRDKTVKSTIKFGNNIIIPISSLIFFILLAFFAIQILDKGYNIYIHHGYCMLIHRNGKFMVKHMHFGHFHFFGSNYLLGKEYVSDLSVVNIPNAICETCEIGKKYKE